MSQSKSASACSKCRGVPEPDSDPGVPAFINPSPPPEVPKPAVLDGSASASASDCSSSSYSCGAETYSTSTSGLSCMPSIILSSTAFWHCWELAEGRAEITQAGTMTVQMGYCLTFSALSSGASPPSTSLRALLTAASISALLQEFEQHRGYSCGTCRQHNAVEDEYWSGLHS